MVRPNFDKSSSTLRPQAFIPSSSNAPSNNPSPPQTLDRYCHMSQHRLSLTSFLERQARATRLSAPLLYLAMLSTGSVSGLALGPARLVSDGAITGRVVRRERQVGI